MTNFPGVNWSTFFPKNVGERQQNYEAGQQRLAAIRDWYRSFDGANQLSLPDNFRLPGFSEFGENLGGTAYGAAEMLNPYNSVVRGTQAYNKAAVGTEDRAGDDGQWYEADLTGKQRFDAGVEALTEVAGTAILPAAGGAAALKYAAGAKPSEEVVRVASDLLSSGLVLSKSAQDVGGAATKKVLQQFAEEGRPVDTSRRNFVAAMAATPVAMATAKLPRFDGALSKSAQLVTDKLGALSKARKSLANQLKLSDAFDVKYPDPYHNNPFVHSEDIIDPISNKAGDSTWWKQRDDMVDQVNEVNATATQASKDFTQSVMDDLSPKELAELDSKVLDEVYDGLRANNDNTRTVYGPQHRNLSQTGDSLLDHGPIQIQVKPSDPEFAIQQQKAMIKVAKAQLKNPERSKRAQRIIKQAEDEIEWIKSTIPKPLTKAEEEAKRRMAEGIRAQAEKTEKARLDSERLAMQKVMDKHGLTPEDYGKLSIEDFFD
jgi:hypothetical protein